MQSIRLATQRGHFQNDWLNSQHSFSFGEYYDPEHRGISILRVINDDRVIPGAGFPTHPHNNMEIVSYVLEGELAHKDSIGNGSTIRPGDVQRMSAGTGITHSEFNPSDTQGTHFLQIWLLPNQRNVVPSYAQKHFPPEQRQGQLRLLISPDGRDGSLSAQSDALMYSGLLGAGETAEHTLADDRIAYLHIARGSIGINGEPLNSGDGITISEEDIKLIGKNNAEVLLFDLPKLG